MNDQMHYHVCTGPVENMPVSDVMFKEYEESISCFVGLANYMFKELRGSDYDLTIEQALEATGNGNSMGAFVGPGTLTLYWFRCEEKIHNTPSWN